MAKESEGILRNTPTPLLDTVEIPADLRKLAESDLRQVADELRLETIEAVSMTGGHLGAGLGVVELTVALHYVFDTPHDRLIWDVGHQAYPHKILTGRRDRIRTLRMGGGLSGYTRRSESEYDPFGAAHSSTSISAGLGMAVARDLKGETRNVIAVIGDGAMSAGMAYEAMNNAGAMESRLIVILNDNDMSIAPPVGGMSAYLSRLISSHSYRSLRHLAKDVVKHLPEPMRRVAKRAEEYARGMVTGGTLFEELGFYYVGPIDGHNLEHLLPVLRNVRDWDENAPVLIHVVTEKGHGYAPAEAAADKLHAVSKFDVVTGVNAKAKAGPPTYTKVFAQALMAEAAVDDTIVAITAAMPSGTGLDIFGKTYPDRTFDVGIAEQHAVTFAAGLASEGLKPFAAIYSTFLQRAYDQVVHDVAIQSLPVRFALDRAGLVGRRRRDPCRLVRSGLSHLPAQLRGDGAQRRAGTDAYGGDGRRDRRPPLERRALSQGRRHRPALYPERGTILPIGRGRVIQQGATVALVSLGTRLAGMHEGRRTAGGQGVVHDGRRRPLRQADRHRPDPQAGARARGADHRRGRLLGRVRRHGAGRLRIGRPARPGPEDQDHDLTRPLYRPRHPDQAV